MKVSYDPIDADAIYFELIPHTKVDHSKTLDDLSCFRIIDYDKAGRVLGVEFISPSVGVSLQDIPHADVIIPELEKLNIPFTL